MADTNRWRAFAAAFLGWMLDGYDFTILTLVLIEVQGEFGMTSAQAGALGTVTLLTRLIGGAIGGRAADRWGRKTPLMISIVWFSIFSLLSGLSTNYWMLFLFRALFGLGMGAEWAAGMPLVLEHWPERLRGANRGSPNRIPSPPHRASPGCPRCDSAQGSRHTAAARRTRRAPVREDPRCRRQRQRPRCCG